MVVSKFTSKKRLTSGSPELLEALPSGMMRRFESHFGISYDAVRKILSGVRYTQKGVPEAAARIVAFYKEMNYEEKINEILKDYDTSNKTRN